VEQVEQVRQTLEPLNRGDEIVIYPDVQRGFLTIRATRFTR